MRLRRIAAVAAGGFLLATFAWPVDPSLPAGPPLTQMSAERLDLGDDDSASRRIGGLVFLEGWRLASRDVRFGGISAIDVAGDEVLALSDSGSILRFPVPRAAGAMPLAIGRIARGPGGGRWKSDRDAEALVVSGGRIWVAFEGRNAVWRYRLADWRFEAAAAPEAMRDLPFVRGGEAMVRLPDGRFLIFAEGPRRGDGATPLLLFEGDPALAATRTARLHYRPPRGFRPTDAALLPDGRLLLLNRAYGLLSGWRAILTVVDVGRLRPGAAVEGRVLASLPGPVSIDNMEALSVTREGRRTIVWIASDDNFNPLLQRTLFLKFALAE